MRTFLCLSILSAVCGVASLRADLTIVEHVDGIGQTRDATMMVKAGRTRVDPSPGVSLITDIASGETISLLHAQKMYTRFHTAQAAILAMELPNMPQNGGISLTPIGRKETIGGYASDEYTCTPHLPANVSEKHWTAAAGMKTTLWLSKSVPDYASILQEMSAFYVEGPLAPRLKSLFGSDLAALPGFPVRIVYEFQPGQAVTSTVVSISNKPIADSEFDIPVDYTPTPTFSHPAPPALHGAKPPFYLRNPDTSHSF